MNHSRNLENLVREAVHDLAAEGRPVDLGAPALRTAHRVRVRRAVSAAAALLVVIGGLAFAVNRGGGTDRSIPPAEHSPTATSTESSPPTDEESVSALPAESPLLLPGGWLVRTAPAAGGGMIIYEDGAGRYRLVAYDGVVSPNGRFVARFTQGRLVVRTYDDEREVYSATARESVRPVWAPDSSRVAFVMLTAEGTKVRTGQVDGTETTSGAVQCESGCVLKWLDGGQKLRVYAGGNYRVEVSVAGGPVGPPSAVADDPCGRQVLAYPIDPTTWLCVTTAGFAVTTGAGVVRERVPFPTTLGGVGVQAGDTHYDLFRPK